MKQNTGREYELACARILSARGYRNVRMTPESGDQGIDILAEKAGVRSGIQCKYYRSPVGNKAVQEAVSGAVFYDCDQAVVMTNSTFTKAAEELAARTGAVLLAGVDPARPESFGIRKFVTVRILNGIVLAAVLLLLLLAGPKPAGCCLIAGAFFGLFHSFSPVPDLLALLFDGAACFFLFGRGPDPFRETTLVLTEACGLSNSVISQQAISYMQSAAQIVLAVLLGAAAVHFGRIILIRIRVRRAVERVTLE